MIEVDGDGDRSTLFANVGALFPEVPEEWGQVTHPARVFSGDLRIKIRRRFGSLTASSDLARLQSPHRQGVALRPYESGDSLRTLSRSHLLKRDEAWTRTDWAEGRQRCGIVLHGYPALAFRAPESEVNKGQVALAAAGLIELAHDGLGHGVAVKCIDYPDLDRGLMGLGSWLRRCDYLYVLTDLLFDSTSVAASGERLLNALIGTGKRRVFVGVVRDRLETPDGNRLVREGWELEPFEQLGNTFEVVYSGEEYGENLRRQLQSLRDAADRWAFSVATLSGSHRVDDFMAQVRRFLHHDARNRV